MLRVIVAMCLLGQTHLVKDEALSEAVLRDYVAKQTSSQNQIRDHILALTPLGSTPDRVLKVLQEVLHKPSNGYKKDFFTSPPYHGADANEPEMYVAGCIGVRYKETSSWLGTGSATDVVWFFNPDAHLINVVVEDWNTGP
jgi:hypothetical protein